MAKSRATLHSTLVSAFGSEKVYYQPPETIKLTYPCIVYNKDSMTLRHADDRMYNGLDHYTITIITRDPDSTSYMDVLNALEYCRYDRTYVADNLYHFAISTYY